QSSDPVANPRRAGDALPVEERLLLLLAKGTLDRDARTNANSLLVQEVSWPRLLRQARAHSVVPMVFRNLDRLAHPEVPAWALAELRTAYLQNGAYNALLASALLGVLNSLRQADVPALPVKGVTLAASLHRDIGLRVCGDLDLLVPRSMVCRALDCLQANG